MAAKRVDGRGHFIRKHFISVITIRLRGGDVLQEASELIGRQCYTNMGMYLGSVTNLVIDVDSAKIDGIFISDTNPLLVEGSRPVNVPYRWINNVGDIILLKYFPKRVGGKEKAIA